MATTIYSTPKSTLWRRIHLAVKQNFECLDDDDDGDDPRDFVENSPAFQHEVFAMQDDFLEERQKCLLAEEVSNFDTETEAEALEGRGKRKRKRALVHSDSESEDGENHRPLKNLSRPSVLPTFRRESALRSAIMPPAACSPVASVRPPLSDYNFLNKVFKAVEEIKEIVLENRRMLRSFLTRPSSTSTSEDADSLEELGLPASSPEELEALNQKLESRTVRQKLVNQLAVIGGKDLRGTIYNILPKMLLNRLAEQYSYHGQKGKRSLSSHKHVLTVIFKAVRRNQRSDTLTDAEIQTVTADWLKHSKRRKDICKTPVVEPDDANEDDFL